MTDQTSTSDSQHRGTRVLEYLEELRTITDLSGIEDRADEIGRTVAASDALAPDASIILLNRLSLGRVQSDDDAFDSVCSALVKLGVFVQHGNMNYGLAPQSDLDPRVVDFINTTPNAVPLSILQNI